MSKKFCQQCGTELAEHEKFCHECGTSVPAKTCSENNTHSKKNTILAIVFMVSVALTAFLTHQSWCNHDFEYVNSKSPTCTDYGSKYYECRKCGKSKISIVGSPKHELEMSYKEDKKEGRRYYTREIKTCDKCSYSETGDWVDCGDFDEYAAKSCAALWLSIDGLGSILDIDNALISGGNGSYTIAGTAYNLLDKKNHRVTVLIETSNTEFGENLTETVTLCGETVYGHVYYASIDDVEAVNEDRILH